MRTNKVKFIAFMKRQVALLQKANQNGTANNYERALRSFSLSLKGNDIPISKVSEPVINRYSTFLINRGLVRNTVSFYMRILRATYNKAVDQQLTRQTCPFRGVYTGVDQTQKRAISESIIVQLYKTSLPTGARLEFAKDLFIFSYCTRGMSFVDMAFLTKADITDGTISYSRKKTRQLLNIRTGPHMQGIINRYSKCDTKYLFPIIHSANPQTACKEYRTALNEYDRLLKILSEKYLGGCKLTSYTARHSWATNALRHEIPMAVISEGLGHTTEKTTRIYLAALESSILDKANDKILAVLNE